MTDNTEKLPDERVEDLEPKQATEEDADAVRGGGFFGSLSHAIGDVVKSVGDGLATRAKDG